MKIDLKWDKPARLRDGARQNQIYRCADLARFPRKPGIYVFARKFGKNVYPLYIGQATKLKSRIDGQLNNLRLMLGVKHAQAGKRILLVARVKLKRGQQAGKVLDIVESALIKHALVQGHDLLNQQGTKTSVHTIRSKGNGDSRQVAPLTMYVEK